MKDQNDMISRATAIAEIRKAVAYFDSGDTKYGLQVAESIIRALPAVTHPERTGRWVKVEVGDCCYRCSECQFVRDAYLLDESNYCPRCGAHMTEGDEHEQAD